MARLSALCSTPDQPGRVHGRKASREKARKVRALGTWALGLGRRCLRWEPLPQRNPWFEFVGWALGSCYTDALPPACLPL